MNIPLNSRIAVKQSQINNSSQVITVGELICVNGDKATVMLDDELVARQVNLSSITLADALVGGLTDRPNEAAILDMIPASRR